MMKSNSSTKKSTLRFTDLLVQEVEDSCNAYDIISDGKGSISTASQSVLVVPLNEEEHDNNKNEMSNTNPIPTTNNDLPQSKFTTVSPREEKNKYTMGKRNNDVLCDLTPIRSCYFDQSKQKPLDNPTSSRSRSSMSHTTMDYTSYSTSLDTSTTIQNNNIPIGPTLASRFTSILFTTPENRTATVGNFVRSLQSETEYDHTWSILMDSIISSSNTTTTNTSKRTMIELGTQILHHLDHNNSTDGQSCCFLGIQTLQKYLFKKISANNYNTHTDKFEENLVESGPTNTIMTTPTLTNSAHSGFSDNTARNNKIFTAVILLLQECCSCKKQSNKTENDQTTHMNFTVNLFTYFFQPMVRIMEMSSSRLGPNRRRRRTLLSVMAMDTALLILDGLCEVALSTSLSSSSNSLSSCTFSHTSFSAILDHLSDIMKLITTRKQWCHFGESASSPSTAIIKHNNNDQNNIYIHNDDKYTKQECLLAVLSDFEMLLSTAQRQYQECICYQKQLISEKQPQLLLDETCLHQNQQQRGFWDDQMGTICLHLCWHLRGAPISEQPNIKLIGGIWQCLKSNSSSIRNDKIESSTYSMESIVEDLCWASTTINSSTCNSSMELQTQRCIVRSFTAWLASSRSSIRSLKATSFPLKNDNDIESAARSHELNGNFFSKTQYGQCLEALWIILTSRNESCIHLALVSLNRLWALSNTFDSTTNVTSKLCSIDSLLELLRDDMVTDTPKEQLSTDSLDPSSKAACMMIVRLAISISEDVLPKIISSSIPTSAKIEILLGLAGSTNNGDGGNGSSSNFLAKPLLTFLCHPYLQARYQHPAFSLFSPTEVLPGLLEALSSSNKMGARVSSSAAAWICQMITSSRDIYQVVHVLVDILCQFEADGGTEGKSLERCIAYAPMWQRALLSDCIHSDRFATVIDAVIKSMFRMPSRIAPLLLFGELLGNGSKSIDGAKENVDHVNCILEKVAMVIIKQGHGELERTASLSCDNKQERELLYEKLSPILMLRRVPYNFFRLLHKFLSDSNEHNLSLTFWKLRKELMRRLKLNNQKNNTSNADEKRLCAELISRIFPLYVTDKDNDDLQCSHEVNTFVWLLTPSFSQLMRLMASQDLPTINSRSETSGNDLIREITRDCRTALFVACHHVRLIDDASSGAAILATVVFAVNVISFNVSNFTDSEDTLGFDLLQTGCMDFLSFCIDSWTDRCVTSTFIEEIECDYKDSCKLDASVSPKWRSNVVETLNYIIDVVLRLALTGSPPSSWLDVDIWFKKVLGDNLMSFNSKSSGSTNNVSSRVCCINAISLACQRRLDGDEKLYKMAKRIMPSFVSWGRHYSTGETNKSIFHPLCIAAVHQASFICIMKIKSLDCCASQVNPLGLKESVYFLLYWSLEAARGINQPCELVADITPHSIKAMRISGLKLLVAILTVDQLAPSKTVDIRHNKRLIELEDHSNAVAFLHGICNIEQDEDIQKLANHFIAGLLRT